MANEKKLVEQITSMDDDFAQWYTDIVKKAELIDYSSIRGCYVLRPYGYAIWENIQRVLDKMFKDTGHENVYMPMFIPESLLEKEKDHVAGFAPEVAWVTYGGNEKLSERMCVRPTSETLFCEHYKNIIQSWRDLPKLYNQWCSVVRWEKTTRPFLRHCEFLWQEGHTIHATAEEAQAETKRMLDVYTDFVENYLAMPVIGGRKTDSEKFAGAAATYTIEALMHDGKALQSGTSHYFGDGFARAFGIQYSDRENKLRYPHQTSWGLSTRIIGGIIMTHGDNSGLVLPPRIAPIQLAVIPVAAHKGGVNEKAGELVSLLSAAGIRVKADYSDNSPGWKFAESEMKGIPLRLEIGPRDLEAGKCVLVRRDSGEKLFVPLSDVVSAVSALLDEIQSALYTKALKNRTEKTYDAKTFEELSEIASSKSGFIRAMWCGSAECEAKLKSDVGITSRCIPFEQERLTETCICCGGPAKSLVYWGKAY